MGISWPELIIVLAIALVIFGPKRIPEVGASLGRGIRGFKDSLRGIEDAVSVSEESPQQTVASAPAEAVDTPRAEPAKVEVVDRPSSRT